MLTVKFLFLFFEQEMLPVKCAWKKGNILLWQCFYGTNFFLLYWWLSKRFGGCPSTKENNRGSSWDFVLVLVLKHRSEQLHDRLDRASMSVEDDD